MRSDSADTPTVIGSPPERIKYYHYNNNYHHEYRFSAILQIKRIEIINIIFITDNTRAAIINNESCGCRLFYVTTYYSIRVDQDICNIPLTSLNSDGVAVATARSI